MPGDVDYISLGRMIVPLQLNYCQCLLELEEYYEVVEVTTELLHKHKGEDFQPVSKLKAQLWEAEVIDLVSKKKKEGRSWTTDWVVMMFSSTLFPLNQNLLCVQWKNESRENKVIWIHFMFFISGRANWTSAVHLEGKNDIGIAVEPLPPSKLFYHLLL